MSILDSFMKPWAWEVPRSVHPYVHPCIWNAICTLENLGELPQKTWIGVGCRHKYRKSIYYCWHWRLSVRKCKSMWDSACKPVCPSQVDALDDRRIWYWRWKGLYTYVICVGVHVSLWRFACMFLSVFSDIRVLEVVWRLVVFRWKMYAKCITALCSRTA